MELSHRRFWVKGFLFMAAAGCNDQLTQSVSGVVNTELDIGQPVRSQRREHGCGKRWQGGVMASYDRNTDDDVVQPV
jgi:hypothetical protein